MGLDKDIAQVTLISGNLLVDRVVRTTHGAAEESRLRNGKIRDLDTFALEIDLSICRNLRNLVAKGRLDLTTFEVGKRVNSQSDEPRSKGLFPCVLKHQVLIIVALLLAIPGTKEERRMELRATGGGSRLLHLSQLMAQEPQANESAVINLGVMRSLVGIRQEFGNDGTELRIHILEIDT